MTDLILSIYPGIDLLGRGFEAEGFCVVRGPDLIWGGDVRSFHPPAGRFDGVIGGTPCQEFSTIRRAAPTGIGVEMLRQYLRVVAESGADWFLLENVPEVPDVQLQGYAVQRFDLNARECGSRQSRLRHFQFGSRRGLVLVPERCKPPAGPVESICLATEGERVDRRSWADFCELQGLPRDFDLPGMSTAAKYRAVGNGVYVGTAQVIARAIRSARLPEDGERLCICQCGRLVSGDAIHATPACRKRMQRRRECDRVPVTLPGAVTASRSL